MQKFYSLLDLVYCLSVPPLATHQTIKSTLCAIWKKHTRQHKSVPAATNSRLAPLPHEPADFYDRSSPIDILLDSASDLNYCCKTFSLYLMGHLACFSNKKTDLRRHQLHQPHIFRLGYSKAIHNNNT
ncbi:secretory carrier-associated membrane protein 2 [Artemisia annua]|uniref:Secretory carrier-associated membrane protein 2 n=1 Tax=Artemisia annua TaxID=35608 RepID=A0A2U1N8W0_ARTAN|nr:secretory carrier-associated membrane protein 2 [Artemisia annua]